MTRRIPLIARDLKRLYTGFLLVAVILFLLCSYLTEFNPMVLAANGDAFWEFITEDFLPPALPKASRIPGIFSSVLVTLALAMSATTVSFQCGGPHRGGGVLLQPAVQPLAQGHLTLLPQIHIPVLLDVPVKLCQQFLLTSGG